MTKRVVRKVKRKNRLHIDRFSNSSLIYVEKEISCSYNNKNVLNKFPLSVCIYKTKTENTLLYCYNNQ